MGRVMFEFSLIARRSKAFNQSSSRPRLSTLVYQPQKLINSNYVICAWFWDWHTDLHFLLSIGDVNGAFEGLVEAMNYQAFSYAFFLYKTFALLQMHKCKTS
jgi:hypothetical protein